MNTRDLIEQNADGTFTVAGMATVLTEADALALLSEVDHSAPTSSPVCTVDPTQLSHRWERVA